MIERRSLRILDLLKNDGSKTVHYPCFSFGGYQFKLASQSKLFRTFEISLVSYHESKRITAEAF